jgi:Rad3-related DNA helicase
MQFYARDRKLIYCSRTVPEIEKALAELKRLMVYREEMGAKDEGFRGLGLTSRRNLCLHPEVCLDFVSVVEVILMSNPTGQQREEGKDRRCKVSGSYELLRLRERTIGSW